VTALTIKRNAPVPGARLVGYVNHVPCVWRFDTTAAALAVTRLDLTPGVWFVFPCDPENDDRFPPHGVWLRIPIRDLRALPGFLPAARHQLGQPWYRTLRDLRIGSRNDPEAFKAVERGFRAERKARAAKGRKG